MLPFLRDREPHVVDLPRFGPGGIPPAAAADWLGDWIADAGLADADVAGHSLGGLIAAELAARRPETVRRLVLVAPAGVPSGRGLPGHALPLLATMRGTPFSVLGHALRDGLRAGPASLLYGGLYASRRDIRVDLGRVDVPTLLVWGERDPLVPPHLAEEWARALPDVRLVVLRGAGHVPMFDVPADLGDAMRAFLDESGDASGSGVVDGVGLARDDDELASR